MHRGKAALPILAATALSAMTAAFAPAMAQGAQGEMFRRHFFRGQAYHGDGYAAQVSEMGQKPSRVGASGTDSLEAQVEPGTRGAAIADCAARFKTFDPSTNTYVGRGGRRYACR